MNNITKIIIGVVVAALVVWGVNSSNQKSVTTSKGPLKIGVIALLTGPYAFVGQNYANGANLAAEDWNKTHPDAPVTLVIEDDGGDGKKGLTAYQKLMSLDKVDALANVSTFTIDAIYDTVSKQNFPVALGFEQGIAAADDNVFQVFPASAPVLERLGTEIQKKGYKNLAVFVSGGTTVFDRFFDDFKKGYGSEGTITEFKIPAGTRDPRTDAAKAVALHPDAYVFLMQPLDGAFVVKEVQSLAKASNPAVAPQLAFDQDLQTGLPEYVKVLGDSNKLNGSYVVQASSPFTQVFIDSYQARFNKKPEIGAEVGYNSIMLLASTRNKDGAVWIKNIKNADYPGVDGQIKFNEVGLRSPDVSFGMITNGALPK